MPQLRLHQGGEEFHFHKDGIALPIWPKRVRYSKPRIFELVDWLLRLS